MTKNLIELILVCVLTAALIHFGTPPGDPPDIDGGLV